MRRRKDKNSDENVTALLSTIDGPAVAPDQEFLKQLRERSAREFTAGAPDVPTNTPQSIHIAALGRIIMRSPITKLAAAAVVVIACVIGLSLWRTTGSGIALADVLARVEQATAFRYRWVTGEDPNKETRRTCLISQEYGSKTTTEELDPNGGWRTVGESYLSPDRKTAIRILHKQKRYRRIEWDDVTAERMYMMSVNDPRTFLKRILACKYESMGRSTIDGIEVEGFQTTDPNFYHFGIGNQGAGLIGDVNQISVRKVWVDTKTRLPVRCDSTEAQKVEEFGMYDFQWDVSVDAADFKPVIPDDYTGTVTKYPAQQTNEETTIRGLKIWVELIGKYPEIIRPFDFSVLRSALEKSETRAATRLKEETRGLTEDEIRNKLADFLMPIAGIGRFYRLLQYDKKDPAYYWKIVTPKDTDKVLMRWKVSDSEYRVIYGDLHAETVTPEKLAELEAALPK
jgi:hypothetical protein